MTQQIQPQSEIQLGGEEFLSIGHEVGQRKCILVNPSDRDWTSQKFVLWFGACGTTRLVCWANSYQDAFDESIDWIVENAPGLLCDESVNEEYNSAIAEGLSIEDAMERAEQDTTTGGNCGNRVNSWENGIALDNPTRKEFTDFVLGL